MKHLTNKSYWIGWLTLSLLLICCPAIATAQEAAVAEYQQKQKGITAIEQRLLKVVSVNFQDTPIDDVIKILADQGQINITKSPQISGNVTALITDVPLGEALENILAAHGYGFVPTENMIRIVPQSQIEVQKQAYVSKVYRIVYANVTEVQKALQDYISEAGSVAANPGTSNIIVTDTEEKIKAIDNFILEIDRITPQVLVEVRIYDITSKDRLDIGVNWVAGTATTFDALGRAQGITNTFIRGVMNSDVNKATGSDSGIRFGILDSNIDIDAIIRAEQEEILAHLLANPRILVLDNEHALFKSVSEIPYQKLQEASYGGSIGTTEFREVGVELDVTPHVARDSMIRLHVMPQFSVATGSVMVGGFEIQSPQPVVDTRKADTTLIIKDGQTIVLGGLRKKEVIQQINKVPLLGDIPLLGAIFRFEGNETVISELVVFITPRIVTDPVFTPAEREALLKTEIPSPKHPETIWRQKDK
ncbi:MAG: hypothetical protein AMJ79_02210 [Phycisphaerae bacterium SM23_30]|nr:MAG: hypothetical protein AMJ79_02210 [Phycisphaerae bacterium SM23_30]